VAKRRGSGQKHSRRQQSAGRGPSPQSRIIVRQVEGGLAWELVPPRCAQERADDIAQVHQMLAEGETEIARDELRWLLAECAEFIEAHKLLGELALVDEDFPLARGHFGNAFQLGQTAIGPAPKHLPYQRPANQPFFEAGKGLAWSLMQLKKPELASEVLQQLLTYDPTDPLNLRELLNSIGFR